jgi:hypothetical protein
MMNQFQAGLSRLAKHTENGNDQNASESRERDDATVKAASAVSERNFRV